MKKSNIIILGVVACGAVLTACAVYAAQPQVYEVAAFRSAITTLEGNYSNHSVLASNLQTLGSEVTKLNARLALDDVFENADEIKQTITDADKLVSRIDLADPTVTVDDTATAATELEALKQSLGIALDNYGLSHAVAGVECIDLATPEYGGTVGDTLDLTPAVYPTMAKGTVLTYASSDPAVVTVDENGSVILVGAGTAEVTVADANSGVQTSMAITSKAAPVQAKPQTPPAQQQAPAAQQKPQTPPAQQKPQKPAGGAVSEPQFTDDFDEAYDDMKEATGGKAGTMGELADLSREEAREIAKNFNW